MNLSELLTPQYFWAILLLLPGFLTLKIYYLFAPEVAKSPIDKVIDYFAATVFVVAANALIVVVVEQHLTQTGLIAMLIGGAIVVPIILALSMFPFRRLLVNIGAIHPTPKAWDAFFSRQSPCFIKFHLRTGVIVGGYYGVHSFASSFPHEEDVYLEQTLYVDQDSGKFTGFIEDSYGMLVKHSDCLYLEISQAKGESNG